MCEASGVGAELDAAAFPADAAFAGASRMLATRAGRDAAAFADALRVAPGDDYELLLAIDPARFDACVAAAHAAGTPLTAIGRFGGAPGQRVLRCGDGTRAALAARGFDHFA